MSAFRTTSLCEGNGVNPRRQVWQAGGLVALLAAASLSAAEQSTNGPVPTKAPSAASTNAVASAAPVSPASTISPQAPPAQAAPPPPAVASAMRRSESSSSRLDDAAFRIISDRNIFNAGRSGGQVRLSTRRPARVESFTLVGTMAYEKGAFAFFNGTSSEFSKVLKADGVIAGHKVVDILNDAVKLEADGKTLELAVGSAMRREDEGNWHPGEGVAGSNAASSDGDRADRGSGSESPERAVSTSSTSSANQSEILKRLMERREKESQ